MHSTWVSQGSSRAGWGWREGAGAPTAASQGREGGAGAGAADGLVCMISADWRDVGLALVVWLLAQGDRGRGMVARSVGGVGLHGKRCPARASGPQTSKHSRRNQKAW